MFQKMFDELNIPKTSIDQNKLRELTNFVNVNPTYIVPSLLLKEPVHISKSIALQVSQDIMKDIMKEQFGIEMSDKNLT